MASQSPLRLARTGVLLVLAGLCVRGFYDAAIGHGGYRIAYGFGVTNIHPNELVFYLWYLVFGIPAAGFLAAALAGTTLPERLTATLRTLLRRPRRLALGAALVLLLAVLASQHLVLQEAPIADDEATYTFVGQTLAEGRVVNPAPGDNAFFKNQFIILNQSQWYGKYPIGHPVMLAIGELLGAPGLVVPLITALCLLLTWSVGRRLVGRTAAGLGVCLLLISPQFVLTGATRLSQPTMTLMMLAGLWALFKLAEAAPGRRLLWALAGGALFGFGVLVRPLPGGLFLVVAALTFLLAPDRQETLGGWKRRLGLLALAAIPVAVCAAVFLGVNRIQTGASLQSGYHKAHNSFWLLRNHDGRMSVSLGGGLLRQNFWLFGWTLSYLAIPFCRPRRGPWLFWGLIGAELFYRLLVPKTVVATTGPIYLLEIVPLLALASADGLLRLRGIVDRWAPGRGERRVAAAALAATLVAALTFWPVQLREIHRGAQAWWAPYELLQEAGAGKALVFAELMIPPPNLDSWAYFPPNPSPNLDDEVIFLRAPAGPEGARRAVELWRRRFPDRTAWVLSHPQGVPTLDPILPRPPTGPTGSVGPTGSADE